MADSAIVKCPSCTSQLKLGFSAAQLAGKKIKCPRCSATFAVKGSATSAPETSGRPASAAARKPAKSGSAGSPVAGSNPAREPVKEKTRSSSSAGAAPKAQRRKRKKKPVEEESLEWVDDYGEEEAEFFDDYSSGNDYGDGDLFGGGGYDDPYGAPAPRRKKKKKKKSNKAAGESGPQESPNHGFLGWLAYGLGASVVCAGLTTLVGMIGVWWLVVVMSIVTGTVVGGGIRYAAGYNQGWGPGLVAVVLALGSMFLGKVGAISVRPEFQVVFDHEIQSRDEIDAEIAKYSSEDSMISDVADMVEADTKWRDENGVTDDMIEDHWSDLADDASFQEQYLPEVWTEATRRWNEKTDEEKQQQMDQTAADMRSEYGLMTDDEMAQLVIDETSDEKMVFEIAQDEVEVDEEWMSDNGVTDEQIEAHIEQALDEEIPAQRFLPAVWEEAERRWQEMSDEDRKQRLDGREALIREQYDMSEESVAEAKAAVGFIKIIGLVIFGLGSMFWPIGALICTGSGAMSAFKIGSGLATDG